MKLSKSLLYLSMIGTAVGISSCSILFSPEKQKVVVKSATEGATIYYNDDSIGVGRAKKKIARSNYNQVFSAEKEGYKTRTQAVFKTKVSGRYFLSFLDIAVLAPLWIGHHPRLWNYPRTITIPTMEKFVNRDSAEKYMFIDKAAIKVKNKDYNYFNYSSHTSFLSAIDKPSTYKEDTALKGRKDKNAIDADYTVFEDPINKMLSRTGYIDTLNLIFPNMANTLSITANIKSITFRTLNSMNGNAVCSRMYIEWDIQDYFKQSIYKTHTDVRSDVFNIVSMGENSTYTEKLNTILKDNVEYSFLKLQSEIKEKGLLKAEPYKRDSGALISVAAPVVNTATNKFLAAVNSVVTVKVDDGHGSGIVFSDDGYIITNYHVVAGSKKLQVLFNNDTTKYTATLVRKSLYGDLALIKIDRKGLQAMNFVSEQKADLGMDVWAIGTPRNLKLGQSLTRGIISAIRKANENTFLQTDVQVSPGNSGGALVDRDGNVIGVICSKLVSLGTEGVSFAVSANQVFEMLNLGYKK